ncbi:MAG: aspartate-semialdehyde dehydrogenase [Bdellovibrionales bacterium]|nr:aspartate-semialdehyde dehydrogenase [Bdellovibrionales bacterium]MBT3526970.1 aspartate-semialdehyde dehydrogenase [Bdellovibrionales bacterium]MBT7670334.1 aspartate-semialdehyde dehydrogenase [Bdellovibrionales bacterium]MBT7766192.1 aspartate-semialdehyde dehydrogenase [Bdellovibrionales bacterium]
MKKNKVGIIGQRGMVGSVLMERMKQEGDFKLFEAYFFSTSQIGQDAPEESYTAKLLSAMCTDDLNKMDIIITCQGSDYTKEVYPKLRQSGWRGYWIDAASHLRMEGDSQLLLDPLNSQEISSYIKRGGRCLVGANCTVSLLLMAMGEWIKRDLVEWVSSMTYQAASGAGAKAMAELISQMKYITQQLGDASAAQSGVELDRLVTSTLSSGQLPVKQFGAPLALSVLPWIDSALDSGQTREEWKAEVEANKILGLAGESRVAIDGCCVRIGAMRSHSQGITVKLKRELPIDELQDVLVESHPWLKLISNSKERTLQNLTPAKVSGSLDIAVGRVRTMTLGPEYITLFTVGDQLLWGAAEPLRRGLRIILEEI